VWNGAVPLVETPPWERVPVAAALGGVWCCAAEVGTMLEVVLPGSERETPPAFEWPEVS